jgi:hypothetical protein
MARTPKKWMTKYEVYELLPLSETEILAFLQSYLSADELHSGRMRRLLDELRHLLSIPRLLTALANGVNENRLLNFGLAINLIFGEMWKAEEQRSRGGAGSLGVQRKLLTEYAIRCVEDGRRGFYLDEDCMIPTEYIHWFVNSGLLTLTDERPECLVFRFEECIDWILAESIVRAEKHPSSSTYSERLDRIMASLPRYPDRQSEVARIVLGLIESDVSEQPWRQWMNMIVDPVLRLQAIAERRVPSLSKLGSVAHVLQQVHEPSNELTESTLEVIGELVFDPDHSVQCEVVKNLSDRQTAAVRDHIVLLLQNTNSPELLRLTCQRLHEIDYDLGHEDVRAILTHWLLHRSPREAETVLEIVASHELRWAADDVYHLATAANRPESIREQAKATLERLADPRYEKLVGLAPITAEQAELIDRVLSMLYSKKEET